jgi:membrane protein
MNRKELYGIFKTSLRDWLDDNATLRAAALTFFIILPLPTLLFIVVGIFSLFFGANNAIGIVVLQISAVAGPAVAGLFNQLLTETASPFTSVWTAIVVVGFTIVGAVGAFSVLRDAMDCIWEVNLPKGQPLRARIRQKIVPFVLVSALGLIVIAWTALSGGVFRAIMLYSRNSVIAEISIAIVQVILSFGVATLLLAIIYKMIPQTKVHWEDVTIAAVATGIAFTVANYIFGTYIYAFTVTTVAGAAGALLIILLWIFVLNQIVLFGAEVSKVYAVTSGMHAKRVLPKNIRKITAPIEKLSKKIEEEAKKEFMNAPKTVKKTENSTENMLRSTQIKEENENKQ